MPKMVAPDKGVKQTDIGNARYTVNRDGVYNVENSSHVRAMKREGYIEASLMGPTHTELGYTCPQCGFASWFKTCSRCGSEN